MLRKKSLIISLLLFFLVLPTLSSFAQEQEGPIIKEILILGNTRTPDKVILDQLPFVVGDHWRDSFRPWTYNRLVSLNIFAYDPLLIIKEPLEEGCRVIIRLADPHILYKDPAEYAFTTGIGLLYSSLNQTLYNPFGYGQNLGVFLNWGETYHYQGEISSPLGAGVVHLSAFDFYQKRTFLEHEYETQGMGGSISYRYWLSENWRQTSSVRYYNNRVDDEEQEILYPSVEFYYQGDVLARFNLDTGFPPGSIEEDPFYKVEGAFLGQFRSFFGLLRGGLASENTPQNYRFQVGGFSHLPLRGEQFRRLTTGYLMATGEYHSSFFGLIPLTFVDLGWVVKDEEGDFFEDAIINMGIGLAIKTPLGLPVRFDVATNPQDWEISWNIGFGHTFSPPF